MSSPVSPVQAAPARPVPLRTLFTPMVWLRLALGWGTFLLLMLFSRQISADLSSPVIWGLLGVIILVILVCAFGVMEQAEGLAHRLGDPYGTLVLTLSVVGIEVILISAVLLGPGDHPTIARDSIMAVSMIILNLVLGLALLLGGFRHGSLAPNRAGVSAYLAMLVLLIFLAFALPPLIGVAGAFTSGQAVPVVLLTIGLYVFFLYRQMGPQKTDFQEPSSLVDATPRPAVTQVIAEHRSELSGRFLLLLAMILPIVLLSHTMATLLDAALDRVGAPLALSGILIAAIVFLPETITTLRAALSGEMQRVSNLTHGALVSTVGLSVPVVLLISLLTGQVVVFAESPVNLLFLLVTLLMSVATFAAPKVGSIQGATHLVLFVLYLMSVFS